MPRINLRKKLLLLPMLAVMLTLVLAGLGVNLFLYQLHLGAAEKELQRAEQAFDNKRLDLERHLNRVADDLAPRDDVVAVLSLISNYKSVARDPALLFQAEQKRLAQELRKASDTAQLSRVLAYDADGELVAWVLESGFGLDAGIVSHQTQPHVLRFADSGTVEDETFDTALLSLGGHIDEGLGYHLHDGVRQVLRRPVQRIYPDGRLQQVGTLVLVKELNNALLRGLQHRTGLTFSLLDERGRLLGESEALEDQRPPTVALAQALGEEAGRLELDDRYWGIRAYPAAEGRYWLLVGYDKRLLKEGMAGATLTVLLVFVLTALLVLPLTWLFVRREVTAPLGALLDGVQALMQGNYRARIPRQQTGELDDLAHAMNRLAESVQNREDYLAEVIESFPQMVFVKDAQDLRFTMLNRAGERLLGISRDEFIGKSDRDFFPAEQAAFFIAKDREVLERGETLDIPEERIETAHGERILHTRKVAIYDHDGKPRFLLGVSEDITAHKRAEETLHEREALLKSVVGGAPVVLFALDREGRFTLSEGSGLHQLGLEPGEVVGLSAFDVYGDNPQVVEALQRALAGENLRSAVHVAGRVFETQYTPMTDSAGKLIGTIGVAVDVTERVEAEARLQQAATVFENTGEGVMITDPGGKILMVNRAFTQITGYGEDEVRGRTPAILRSGRHDAAFFKRMWTQLRQEGLWQGEILNRRKNGEIFAEWQTISAVYDENRNVTHYVTVFADISDLKAARERLDFMAYHDPLTELPNRLLLNDRIQHAISRADRRRHSVAVLFLDLDRFKTINDSLGHPVGDALLQTIARELQDVVREEDTLARLGGDEFVLVLHEVDSREAVTGVADKVLGLFKGPFTVEGRELGVGVSIGISLYPQDGKDVTTLIRNADAAMYLAKEQGRNRYRFYTQELTLAANQRLELENDLRKALQRNELEVHYQPKVDLTDGTWVGAEALLRWPRREGGPVSPLVFIPVAEETGLIHELGAWVLRKACEQMRQWQDNGAPIRQVAVNVSSEQFLHGNIIAQVEEVLKDTGLSPSALELEVTEALFMEDTAQTVEIMNHLRQLGVSLAVDDFGTGYSSLGYLKRLPLNTLKIDASFVRDMIEDENDRAIADSVIALGHTLGMTVVAEGVENEQQAAALRQQGCDQAQGYLYSRPQPAEALVFRNRSRSTDGRQTADIAGSDHGFLPLDG